MEQTVEQVLHRAVDAHREGKLQEAERLYRAILQTHPSQPDANHNLGVLALAVGKSSVAIPLFQKALQANPSVEQFWLSYIGCLVKEAKFDAAVQAIADATDAGVSIAPLLELKKRLHEEKRLQESDAEKAPSLSKKRKAIPHKKRDAKTHRQKTAPPQNQLSSLVQYFQAKQFTEAEKLAVSLTLEFPNHQLSWKLLGAIYGQQGRHLEAAEANRSAVKLCPQDPEVHSNLGVALSALGRLEEAEKSLKSSISINPKFAPAHFNLGNTLMTLGKFDEAEVSLRQAVTLDPKHAKHHYNLGITLKTLGKLNEAEAAYRQAILLDSNYIEAHTNLGTTLLSLGKPDDAIASFRRAIALRPDLAEGYYNIGNALKELGKLKDAERKYEEAIAIKTDFSLPHAGLGSLMLLRGEYKEGLRGLLKGNGVVSFHSDDGVSIK